MATGTPGVESVRGVVAYGDSDANDQRRRRRKGRQDDVGVAEETASATTDESRNVSEERS